MFIFPLANSHHAALGRDRLPGIPCELEGRKFLRWKRGQFRGLGARTGSKHALAFGDGETSAWNVESKIIVVLAGPPPHKKKKKKKKPTMAGRESPPPLAGEAKVEEYQRAG
jgi:hypothetical protein